MTNLDATNGCTKNASVFDNSTITENAMTLSSKDRFLITFLVDTLNAGNICQHENNTETSRYRKEIFSYSDCYWYYMFSRHLSVCVYNTSETVAYDECLLYRFIKDLDPERGCQKYASLLKSCDLYKPLTEGLIPTAVCVTGFTANVLSLHMFRQSVTKTSVFYQLQWLAVVDAAYLATGLVTYALPNTLTYFKVTSDLYWNVINPVVQVCLEPLFYTTQICTVWLTVLIALHRYVAVCNPFSNVDSHCKKHGRKHAALVMVLNVLYVMPYLFMFFLQPYEADGHTYFRKMFTDFISVRFYEVYLHYIYATIVVCMPFLVLLFVTVSILVKLRKRKQKRKNMQNSDTQQNNTTVILLTILIAFMICQFPDLICICILWKKPHSYYICGGLIFYLLPLARMGLLLNSSVNGFIYITLNKTFRGCALCLLLM